MEPNDPAAPALGSVADIAARLALWGRRAPKGLARVEFDSDFSRQDVIAAQRQRLDSANVPLYEIELPKFAPAEQVIQFLLDRLASLENGVVSITGWATAFPSDVPLLESLRVLNYNRENLAQFPLCQVWWLTRLFADAFVRDVPDLNAWFMVSLSLTESRTRFIKTEKAFNSFQSNAISLDVASKASAELVLRFRKAVVARASPSDLLNLAKLAVIPLHSFGLRQETKRLAETLLNETISAVVSQDALNSNEELKSDPASAWDRILRDVFYAPIPIGDVAFLYNSQGKAVEAEALYNKAFTVAVETMGKDYPLTNFALDSLALLYRTQQRYDEAAVLYNYMIEGLKKELGVDVKSIHLERVLGIALADRYYDLAETYLAQGNFAQAEKYYQNVLSTQRKYLGTHAYQLIWVLQDLSKFYESLGRVDEAELYKQQAAELDAVPTVPQTVATEVSVPG